MTASLTSDTAEALPHDDAPHLLGRVACILAIFAALTASTTPSPLYPIYIQEWGLKPSTATTIFSVYAAGTLISLFLAPRLDARLDDRRMILIPGLVLTALGSIIFAEAQSVPMLLLGRVLSGLATGLVTGTGSAALFDLVPARQRKRAAVISTVAFTSGAAAGPCISSAALALGFAPLVSPFFVIAALAILAIAGLAASTWPRTIRRESTTADTAADMEPRTRRKLMALACVSIAVAWSLGSMLMATGVTLAGALFGLQIHALAGLLPAIFQAFAGVGQMLAGRIRPLTAIFYGCLALAILELMTVLGANVSATMIFVLAMPLCGLFYGSAFIGGAALVNGAATAEDRARMIGRFYVTGYLSNAVPTLAFGLLIDWLGLSLAFTVFSIALMVPALIGALGARRLRHAF